jgi:hypothetical protein
MGDLSRTHHCLYNKFLVSKNSIFAPWNVVRLPSCSCSYSCTEYSSSLPAMQTSGITKLGQVHGRTCTGGRMLFSHLIFKRITYRFFNTAHPSYHTGWMDMGCGHPSHWYNISIRKNLVLVDCCLFYVV